MKIFNKNKSIFLLGIPDLIPEWKQMFLAKYLSNDLIAGMTVALVAVPLSLAIALASGVSPAIGLVTAIIAGIVCALFGGTPLSVSGPAAAMSVLLADTVEKFGIEGLVFMCLLAGLMQIISGIAGLGKLSRYVPLPVIAGFTAGIGVIILIGQLPRAFGLEPPASSHIIDVFNNLKEYFHEINGVCLLLVVLTISIIRGLPKIFPKLQPILPAIIVVTALTYFFNLDVPLIGAIPHSLPAPHLPSMPENLTIVELLMGALTIYLLASLETLLSSTAVDRLTYDKKHNSSQELIGQGLGNVTVAMFGGIPVTGVIARSAMNINAGAKTRRASIFHSFGLLIAVFAFASVISLVPIAALVGVLMSVAFSMINYREFRELWVTSHSEGFIFAVTFLTIIFVDLIAGVKAGIIISALIVLYKATQTRLHISQTVHDEVVRLSISGALTFLSTGKIALLEKEFQKMHAGCTVLLDLSELNNLDTSGASAIIDLYNYCNTNKIKFYMTGVSKRFESLFMISGDERFLEKCYVMSEHEIRTAAPEEQYSSYGQLIHGVSVFHTERMQNDKRLYDFIRKKQNPHTLFITCSDSRIVPSEMTSAHPGDLFIVRNVGNYVPPYNTTTDVCHSEYAALEFALSKLEITDIVVCGHANCGAIKACRDFHPENLEPKLAAWITMIHSQLKFTEKNRLNEIARMNILNQITNLKTYPIVQERLKKQSLALHAWFFDFEHSMVYEWDEKKQSFSSLIGESALVRGFNML